MADNYFQQFGRAKLVVIFSLWIVSAYGFFRLAIIPLARRIISYILSSFPSHWIAIKAWLSPPYIYILLNLIILTIAAQNHLLPVPNWNTKRKLTQKTTLEKEENTSYFSNENSAVALSPGTSPATVDFPETSSEEKLGDQKADEDCSGEPVLDTLEEAWKKIMEAQGKKAD